MEKNGSGKNSPLGSQIKTKRERFLGTDQLYSGSSPTYFEVKPN